jgi:hypothetical protein
MIEGILATDMATHNQCMEKCKAIKAAQKPGEAMSVADSDVNNLF